MYRLAQLMMGCSGQALKLVSIIIFFVLLFSSISLAQWENKAIEPVTNDTNWNWSVRHYIHMDDNGKIYIGYTEQTYSYVRVYFKTRDSLTGWSQRFEVPIDPGIAFPPSYITMAVNKRNGDVWFAHSGWLLPEQAVYVFVYRIHQDSVEVWKIDTAATGWTGKSLDMVCDSAGTVHLVWYKIDRDSLTNEQMKYPVYAVYYDNTWHKQVAGDTTIYLGYGPPYLFLSITPAGKAYISTQSDLRRNGTLGGTNWETLDWISFLHPYNWISDLEVDRFERVHLFMVGYDEEFCGLKYYVYYYLRDNLSGQWSPPDLLTDEGAPMSMYIDSLGDPHVAWSTWNDCGAQDNVIYAYKKAGQWTSYDLMTGVEFDFLLDQEWRGHAAVVSYKSDSINLSYTDISYVYSNPLDVKESGPEIPTDFQILKGFPNPFNARIILEYYLEKPGTVSLKIYNLLGQCVRHFEIGRISSIGVHQVVWDGTDEGGDALASGIYIARLATNSQHFSRKLVLIR